MADAALRLKNVRLPSSSQFLECSPVFEKFDVDDRGCRVIWNATDEVEDRPTIANAASSKESKKFIAVLHLLISDES